MLFLGASNMTEDALAVKRIDHILLIPEDPRGLYDFLTQELRLPVAWAFREYEGFASGGVFVGNVNLEALDDAREFLSSRRLLGQDEKVSITLNPEKTFGFLLEILEAE
jgi:hypothetical protein